MYELWVGRSNRMSKGNFIVHRLQLRTVFFSIFNSKFFSSESKFEIFSHIFFLFNSVVFCFFFFNLFVFNNSFCSDFVCDNKQHSIKYGFLFECDFSSKHQLFYRIKITAEPANEIEKERKNWKREKEYTHGPNVHILKMNENNIKTKIFCIKHTQSVASYLLRSWVVFSIRFNVVVVVTVTPISCINSNHTENYFYAMN